MTQLEGSSPRPEKDAGPPTPARRHCRWWEWFDALDLLSLLLAIFFDG